MSTIADVAKLAGVSVCTVSHAIHGTRPVRAETRRRVLDAVAELGYRPNLIAQGLKTKRTHTVGVLVAHVRVPSVGTLVTGAEGVLVAHGYSPILCCTPPHISDELDALGTLTDLRVDGVLAVGRSEEFVATMEAFHDFPVVHVHCHVKSEAVDWVDIDDRRAFRVATEHLLALGHRRVAFVGRPGLPAMFAARREGYCQALAQRGIPVDQQLIRGAEIDSPQAEQALDHLMALPDPPTALVVAHEQLSLDVFASIKERMLRIPDDLAMVGMGDDTWTRVVDPPLTKVAVPSLALGRTAAELLLRRLRGDVPAEPQSVLLESPLVVRRSCGSDPVVGGPTASGGQAHQRDIISIGVE